MARKPLHGPFLCIEGDYFIVINFYDEAEIAVPDELTLRKLSPKEVIKMHTALNYQEAYGIVLPLVRKRLGCAKPYTPYTNKKHGDGSK